MKLRLKLFAKKSVYVPTLWGWLVLLGCAAGVLFVGVYRAYPFLAYDKPNDSDVFIVEGWVPDYVLDRGLRPVQEGHCRLLIVTGGPLEVGSELSRYQTYAEMTAARLIDLGFRAEQVVAVPSEAVDKDRTYVTALDVKAWLAEHPDVKRANLITRGAHARKSYIIYKRVLPAGFELGVCAMPPRGYDPQCWWASSEGFRSVVSEGIGYLYAWLAGPR